MKTGDSRCGKKAQVNAKESLEADNYIKTLEEKLYYNKFLF